MRSRAWIVALLPLAAAACLREGFDGSVSPCAGERGCTPVIAAESGVEPIRVGGVGGTGIEGPYACPPGTVLTGLHTEYERYDRLMGFRMRCHSIAYDPDSTRLAWLDALDGGENYGSQTSQYVQVLDCPEDEYVVAIRAHVGAYSDEPGEMKVMDRVAVGCAWLEEADAGAVRRGELLWVAQELQGSSGLLDNDQFEQIGTCPDGHVVVQLATSGGGHSDHFDIYCATVTLRAD